jgi:hypothetical protein
LEKKKEFVESRKKRSWMNLLPTGAHILVAASDVFYVRLHDSDEGLVVEVASSNPRWELRVPDKGVAVDFLLVGFGEVAVAVGVGEGEVATLRLNGLPLHGILWCERVEVGVVASNGLLGRVATTRISCQPKSRNPQRLIKTYSVRAVPMNSLPRAFIAVAKPSLGLGAEAEGWATAEAASAREVKTSEKRILRVLLAK